MITFNAMERLIKKDGWYVQSIIGAHYYYVHDSKTGKVTIPFFITTSQISLQKTPKNSRLDFEKFPIK